MNTNNLDRPSKYRAIGRTISWAISWVMYNAMLSLSLMMTIGILSPLANANDLQIGKAAPPLVLHTLDGKTLSTDELRGQVIIVIFWATYCPSCKEELPVLSEYSKMHQHQGLQVLGFSLDEPSAIADVKAMAQELKLSFPVGLLGDAHVKGYGRIWRIPVSFVIDRKGNLVSNGWEQANPVWTYTSLEEIVSPLLQ